MSISLPFVPESTTLRLASKTAFTGALIVLTAVAFWLWPLPPLDDNASILLGALTAAGIIAETFTIDFPDRKNVSVGYIFPLIAAALVSPQAGMAAALGAGMVSGFMRGQRVRSAAFHGPQLALAAAAAASANVWLLGGVNVQLSLLGAASLLLYAGIYTPVAWGLGQLEELIADKPPSHASVDLLTNLVLVPLPLGIAPLYDRLGVNGLLLALAGLILLIIAGQAYENLFLVHRQLKVAFARLAEQERQLEQALDTNREMSQVVSHDLRGPLTSVMGYTELLRASLERQAAPEKQIGYLNSIEGNSRRILSLANKLLDLHRLEEGGQVDIGTVQAASVLRQVVEDIRVAADQKRIQLMTDIDSSLPAMQTCEWMLREVAENFVSNAVKYTPEDGHVTVRLHTADEDQVLLEVEDDGIGMSPEDQARLFTKFFRSGNKEVRKQQGTGLGLALTKTMIERLGGSVDVSSQLGQGTRFSVRLPRELEATPA